MHFSLEQMSVTMMMAMATILSKAVPIKPLEDEDLSQD
jgi:hypothetical protein